MQSRIWIALTLAAICLDSSICSAMQTIDLAGSWRFEIDANDVGRTEHWFQRDLADRVDLPGSLQEQGFGDDPSVQTQWTGGIVDRSWFTSPRYAKYRKPGQEKIPFWLQPEKHYVGPAWFQRSIAIPDGWRDKRVSLYLERPHWETTVWVDGNKIGSSDSLSLSTPHVYVLPELQPGDYRLTIRVDNRVKVDVGSNAHSVSDHTQTNWNGLVGKLELRATDRIWIDDARVFPNLANKSARVVVSLGHDAENVERAELQVQARSYNVDQEHHAALKRIPVQIDADGRTTVTFDYPLGNQVQLWDEFRPALYRMKLGLQATVGETRCDEETIVEFGMRHVTTRGTQFVLNGRPIFLRGTLECCIFPLTGYPPTDVESWQRIIRICKAHGLNHMRFHSWCPPKAAFIAADALGFYFQVECSSWANQGARIGDGQPVDRWLYAEADRILRHYGNHPSFLLMAYGNEPAGPDRGARFLGPWVTHYQQTDPRRLYSGAAGWPVIDENQYHDIPGPRIQHWGAGLKSRINAHPPETVTDYREDINKFNVPVVSHEIGQWCVYPNFDEIAKFTGFLKAKNFEIFQQFLAERHMADQARDFLMASGKLQTLCYKEEIESALRTPGFGGFQLLDLHDFPGQGTALVGVLDPFWDSKPYVSPQVYARFCGATVPLTRLERRTFTTAQTLAAQVDVSHFGPVDLKRATVRWLLRSDQGAVAQGKFPERTIVTGKLDEIGRCDIPLRHVPAPAKLKLEVSIDGTSILNTWDVWVYPEEIHADPPDKVHVTDRLDEMAVSSLQRGGRVLLLARPKSVKTNVALGFSSIFWNTAWTRGQAPHTLGILCDPNQPALAAFPTEFHSNWQWWELVHGAATMEMDDLPPGLRPIVQVVPDWFEPKRLGLLFEAKVGNGKLLVCSMDLHSDLTQRPVARQMRHSLMAYLASDAFDPTDQLTVEQVRGLFERSLSAGRPTKSSSEK